MWETNQPLNYDYIKPIHPLFNKTSKLIQAASIDIFTRHFSNSNSISNYFIIVNNISVYKHIYKIIMSTWFDGLNLKIETFLERI